MGPETRMMYASVLLATFLTSHRNFCIYDKTDSSVLCCVVLVEKHKVLLCCFLCDCKCCNRIKNICFACVDVIAALEYLHLNVAVFLFFEYPKELEMPKLLFFIDDNLSIMSTPPARSFITSPL